MIRSLGMVMMNVHERQIKILEENLAHSLGESFNTVTSDDYSHVHTYIRTYVGGGRGRGRRSAK